MKNVIHSTTSRTAKLDEPEIIVFPASEYWPDKKAPVPEQNHMLIRENDDILLINGDRSESRKISTKTEHPIALPAILSPDLNKYMVRNKICNIENSSCITLDTVINDGPDNTHLCGILYYSFNPKYPEVVFNAIFCYDEENEIYRTATFDYNTGRFRIIDDEIDIEGCMYPTVGADGRKIAFVASDGLVHIQYREIVNETKN
jgi:hypothetical protein